MTRKHFIALAAAIREDSMYSDCSKTNPEQRMINLETLLRFCEQSNPWFDREHFLNACGIGTAPIR